MGGVRFGEIGDGDAVLPVSIQHLGDAVRRK
jgi:hypothetical protein